MSASSYNGINGQALYMYVIMWTRRHVSMSACWHNSRYYCLMGIGASMRINMPTCCQAVRLCNVLIFTHCKKLSIIIIATHVNMHRIAFFPHVSRHVYQKDKKFYCNELENLVRHHNYTNTKLLLSALHKATFTSYHHMEMSILLYISFLDFCVMVRALQN